GCKRSLLRENVQ
ncbi:hypothetical protein CP8484711_0254B, partial [Chlamydia psittaci 84-8471/1]